MPEYFQDDIVIELHVGVGNEVDPKLLVETLDILENALYVSDRSDIERAGSRLTIPTYIRDASLERLRNYRHQRVHFREAATGSIVLVGAVAAVALYVLQQTIGEAFTDGFKDSQVYHELRHFFRDQIDRKALSIAESLRRGFDARHRTARVDAYPRQVGPGHRIIVEVAAPQPRNEHRVPPSLGEALDQEPSPPAF